MKYAEKSSWDTVYPLYFVQGMDKDSFTFQSNLLLWGKHYYYNITK